ncbi:hypothetical protein ALP8811_02799 [Aliiroseovarius pelagivivens]|uniref:Uncharacterized protein n=1 Tax=Aliiroseovarius pelagivivens TaxID=1639690 RepID=A0A2R8ASM2_9RHOB|nr:hypothetical protein ALP8811_02799 [Aliiroseovarius pelagivivens]
MWLFLFNSHSAHKKAPPPVLGKAAKISNPPPPQLLMGGEITTTTQISTPARRFKSRCHGVRITPIRGRGRKDPNLLLIRKFVRTADLRCVRQQGRLCGTKRTCAHAAIADAAYFCICGRDKSAPLFPPPDRSLASIIFAQAETAPSLQVCQTNETKTQICSNLDTTASPIASGDDSLTKCSPKTMGTTLVF